MDQETIRFCNLQVGMVISAPAVLIEEPKTIVSIDREEKKFTCTEGKIWSLENSSHYPIYLHDKQGTAQEKFLMELKELLTKYESTVEDEGIDYEPEYYFISKKNGINVQISDLYRATITPEEKQSMHKNIEDYKRRNGIPFSELGDKN